MMDMKEYKRVASIIEALGWRVVSTQKSGRNKTTNLCTSHIHSLAYPPDGGKPIIMGLSKDPRARTNMHADFRRVGIELDPVRIQRQKAKGRRRK